MSGNRLGVDGASRRSSYAVRVLILAAMLIGTVAFTAPVSADGEVDPLTPILFGAHASPVGTETRVEATSRLQTSLGQQLSVVRRYLLWEELPSQDELVSWVVAQGSTPFISVRPQRADGSLVPWLDIATAVPGSPVDLEIRQWAAEIASLDTPVYFTFHHEPEIVGNMAFGSSSEFVAAWRKVVDIFRLEGVTNAEYVWVMTSYAFSRPSTDRRSAGLWYPGDQWVDHIGADPYNWSDCRVNITNNWRDLEIMLTPVRDFAALHPSTGLVVAEFGSTEDDSDPNRKAEWVTEIRRLLRRPEWGQVRLIMAFHADHQEPGSSCDWWVDSSVESLAAYVDLVNDPLFGGTGDGPPPVDPGGTCSVALVADEVTISWTPFPGTEIIRRNGSYLASPPAGDTEWVDEQPPAGQMTTYELRVWAGSSFQDVPCGSVTTDDDPEVVVCGVTVAGAIATVAWSDSAATEIVRRNGAWRATPPASATEFSESLSPGTYDYTLRTWQSGTFTDTPCGVADVQGQTPQCTVVAQGTAATVEWQGFAGRVIVRRNGIWRATPSAGATTFNDTGLSPGTFSYTIREWTAGTFNDTECGSVNI